MAVIRRTNPAWGARLEWATLRTWGVRQRGGAPQPWEALLMREKRQRKKRRKKERKIDEMKHTHKKRKKKCVVNPVRLPVCPIHHNLHNSCKRNPSLFSGLLFNTQTPFRLRVMTPSAPCMGGSSAIGGSSSMGGSSEIGGSSAIGLAEPC